MSWVRSSFCGSGSCVEVTADGDRVLLRDGKLGDASPVVVFTRAEWRGFLESILRRPLP